MARPLARLIRGAALFAAALSLAGGAAAADPAAGFLGRPLAEVEHSGFFGWFHLVESGRADASGGLTVVRYQPSGARFHSLATLEATIDAGGTVRRADLLLLRSFIDSAGDGPFARDIAKSFLGNAPPPTDAGALALLASEVEHRLTSSETVITGPGYAKPNLPREPSEGYKTYAGAHKTYRQALVHATLEMVNEEGADGAELRMTLSGQ